jgi:TetR/AcrR family transcriptional regulator, regulator of autoinduction and epiphytic fitness
MVPVTMVDGRAQRGQRNREAIIDALLACYDAGMLRPSVHEVAARAGVSARSVHNHFDDVESLRAEVAQRQWERFARFVTAIDAALPLATRVDEVVAQRAAFFEGVAPVRRAALLSLYDSPTIAANLARLDRALRRQLDRAFPGLEPDALDALDALASWDAWNRLRTAQGCSVSRARRILTATIRTLVEGSA